MIGLYDQDNMCPSHMKKYPHTEVVSELEAHYYLSDGSIVVDKRKKTASGYIPQWFFFPHLDIPKTWCISLGGKKTSIIDEEDLYLCIGHNWNLNLEGYVQSNFKDLITGKYTTKKLHRIILNAPKGMQVDHKNHIVSDNRKSNIRLATQSQNQFNTGKRKGLNSLKGATLLKNGRYNSYISLNGKKKYIGTFDTELGAHNAYKLESIKHHGEYSFFNK